MQVENFASDGHSADEHRVVCQATLNVLFLRQVEEEDWFDKERGP